MDGSIVNIALPVLQRDLDASMTDAQWIVEIYLLLLSALILVGGSAGDRFGRRRVFASASSSSPRRPIACGAGDGRVSAHRRARRSGRRRRAARAGQPGAHQRVVSRRGPRPRHRHMVGRQHRRRGHRAGRRRLADGSGVVAVGVPHQPAARAAGTVGAVPWGSGEPRTTNPPARSHRRHRRHDRARPDRLRVSSMPAPVPVPARGSSEPWPAARSRWSCSCSIERRTAAPMVPFELFRSRAFTGANLLTLLLYGALGGGAVLSAVQPHAGAGLHDRGSRSGHASLRRADLCPVAHCPAAGGALGRAAAAHPRPPHRRRRLRSARVAGNRRLLLDDVLPRHLRPRSRHGNQRRAADDDGDERGGRCATSASHPA